MNARCVYQAMHMVCMLCLQWHSCTHVPMCACACSHTQVDDTHERLLRALAEFDTFNTQLLRKYKVRTGCMTHRHA